MNLSKNRLSGRGSVFEGLVALLISCIVLGDGTGEHVQRHLRNLKGQAGQRTLPRKGVFVVINRAALSRTSGPAFASLLEACRLAAGGEASHILSADQAYRNKFQAPLSIKGYPSEESTKKARWLRSWLSHRVPPGGTVVLVGNEKDLPTWQVRVGKATFTTDSLYSDLEGNGLPDTGVSRIVGTPELMLRQLQGKKHYGDTAAILCSEDTRIHLETRAFAQTFGRLGYAVAIRGTADDAVVSDCDFIVHFGHGTPEGISNRFGEPFLTAEILPRLKRSPIVFVDGCGTLPVDSPLLHAFLKQGALAYVGATATVQGMIPGRFTNELVEHFLSVLAERPSAALPHLLADARARYIRGHPGLAEEVRRLAETGTASVSGEASTHLLTVAEWVCYGDPLAAIPRVKTPAGISRQVMSVRDPVLLDQKNRSWKTSIKTESDNGQAVLAVYADVPSSDRRDFRFSVLRNGSELSVLDSRHDTLYQRIGRDCRGGYVSGDTYRARYLIPVSDGAGEHAIEIRLAQGGRATLTPGTQIDVWPPDFEKSIGLRLTPAVR